MELRELVRQLLEPWRLVGADGPDDSLVAAIVVVAVLSIVTAGSVVAVGWMMAGAVDGPATVENPDRWPAEACDDTDDPPDSWNCDEPATFELDPQEIRNHALVRLVPIGLLAPPFTWLFATVVLFAGGRLANGDPSGRGVGALAGWAALGEFLKLAVALPALWYLLRGVVISLEYPRGAIDNYRSVFATLQWPLVIVSLVVIAWQWGMLTRGLSRDAKASRAAAATAVGVPLAILGALTFVLLLGL